MVFDEMPETNEVAGMDTHMLESISQTNCMVLVYTVLQDVDMRVLDMNERMQGFGLYTFRNGDTQSGKTGFLEFQPLKMHFLHHLLLLQFVLPKFLKQFSYLLMVEPDIVVWVHYFSYYVSPLWLFVRILNCSSLVRYIDCIGT